MEAITVEKSELAKSRYAGLSMPKADFFKWEADDGFLYEWNNGILEPIKSMKQQEMYIVSNIEDKFLQTEAFRKKGKLFHEIDCWTTAQQMRIPDIAFYTSEQIKQTAQGANTVPAFVVEIISEYDQINKVEQKLLEYFNAGVQVIWRVFPEFKIVYVYNSFKKIQIYTDDDSLDASPAIPDLQITIGELFNF